MREKKSRLYKWYAMVMSAIIGMMTTIREWNDSIKTIKRKP
jgi:hypothetical protein